MSEEIQKMKYVKAVKFLTELGHIDSLINQIEEDYQNTCFKAQPKGITYASKILRRCKKGND